MTTTQNIQQPSKLFRTFVKLQNPMMKWLLRSRLHGFVSGLYLLLTFTGRKSGKVYQVPVQYGRDGQTLYIITSEGYTWWKNLRGGATITVRVRGKEYQAYAETSQDAATIADWVGKVYPKLNAEQRQTFVVGKVGIAVTLKG